MIGIHEVPTNIHDKDFRGVVYRCIAKMALTAATSQQKMTRTDWKKEKELEEARKAGTAPALQDETGKYVKEFLSVLKQFKVVIFDILIPTSVVNHCENYYCRY